MRKVAGAILLLAALLIAALWLRGASRPEPIPAAGPVILFGDSLAEGAGAGPNEDLASALARKLGQPVRNAGRSGDTVASAIPRVGEILAQKPRLVIVLLGGNDALRQKPVEDTFREFGELVRRLKAGGTGILLLGVPSHPLRDGYASRFEALAAAENVGYLPNVLAGIWGRPELMADEIHPNGRGYEALAEKIAPEIKKILNP